MLLKKKSNQYLIQIKVVLISPHKNRRICNKIKQEIIFNRDKFIMINQRIWEEIIQMKDKSIHRKMMN